MRFWLLLAVLPCAAGCASPTPNYYTLAAVPGTPQPIGGRSVELRRVAVPGYLDRSEIVHSTANYQIQVSDRERWGEPVADMVERVFTEDLVQRLPGASVFSESGAISTRPDLVVEVDLQRLDAGADGDVVLLAQAAVRDEAGDQPARAQTVRLEARPASPSTRDLVATESALLGQLADRVAKQLES
jgi:uncharacterized lipoprotein YmbA